MAKPHVTATRLHALFDYDPLTGAFRRKGELIEAGCKSKSGRAVTTYRLIEVDGKLYKAHRLVWLYMFGEEPTAFIDHIDGNGLNNRLDNLRICDQTQNNANSRLGKNNTSGFKGVYWDKRTGKWRVQIQAYGQRLRLGRFADLDKASEAYVLAADRIFGEFARAAA